MANVTKSAPSRSDVLHRWSIADSAELYNVAQWGAGFFDVNARGNVCITARGPDGPKLDLKELVDGLLQRGIELPMFVIPSSLLTRSFKRVTSMGSPPSAETSLRVAVVASFDFWLALT